MSLSRLLVLLLSLLAIAFLIPLSCGDDDNKPPATPIIDSPGNQVVSISITPTLRWKCSDPEGDPLTYDVHFGTATPPPLVSPDQSVTSYSPDTLEYNTTYYWRVVAKDNHNNTTPSPIWNFTTVSQPPSCSVSMASLDFGTVCVGDSKDLSFTIRNIGGGTLSGAVSASCDHYSIVSGGGSYSLGAGQSRTVTVRFAPTSTGTKTCTIETGNDACTDVSCTGNGIDCPECDVSTDSLKFGDVCVGQSKDLTFTITNPSDAATNLTGSVSASCSDYSIVSGTGSYDLNPGQSHTVTVRFSPTSTGTKTCTIQTGSDCSNVSSTGNGIDCQECDVSTDSLKFGDVCVGQSKDLTFTITNPSDAATNLTGSVSASCSDYSIVSGGGSYNLNPGQSRTVTVRFSPSSSGAKTCTIETGNAACVDVSCTGNGEQPCCSVSPSSLDFGDVCMGQSKDSTFTITNCSGTCTLAGTISELCSDYSIVSGSGSYDLNPGQSHTVTVRFSPTSPGTETCTIQTGSDCSNVSSTGNGIDCQECDVSTDSLKFGDVCVGQSKDLTFTITNPSDAATNLTGSVSASCSDYSIVSGGGSYNLSPGQSRTVTVRFSPTSAGSKTCTIETGNNACSDVTCTGNGEEPCCSVSPSSIDFGNVCIGQSKDKTFTITNCSNTCPLSVIISESCSDYIIVSGGGSIILGPGQSGVVNIRFTPTSAGPRPCCIDLGPVCGQICVIGNGVPLCCTVSPTTLNFGDVCVDDSKDKTFTISNCSGTCNLSGTISESCSHYSIVSGGGSYNLSPGQSRTVTVRFAPTSTGTKTCTIETGNSACSNVSCTGTGVPPCCTVSPTTLNFGNVCVGECRDLTFTITNCSGACNLGGTISESCSHYSIVSGGGSYNLGPGQSRTVTVRFCPTSTGTKICTIETGNSACLDVICTGIAPQPCCNVSTTALNFGEVEVGQHKDLEFTITNCSGICNLSGTVRESCSHYSIVSGGGYYNLSPYQTRTVTVRFSPSSTGPKYCTIETGNDACNYGEIYCSGLGVRDVYLYIYFNTNGATFSSNFWSYLRATRDACHYGDEDGYDCGGGGLIMEGGGPLGEESWILFSEHPSIDGLTINPDCEAVWTEIRADVEKPSEADIYVKTEKPGCKYDFNEVETTSCRSQSYNWWAGCLEASGPTEIRVCHKDNAFLRDYWAGIKWVKFKFIGWRVAIKAPFTGRVIMDKKVEAKE